MKEFHNEYMATFPWSPKIGDRAQYLMTKDTKIPCEITGFEIEGATGRRLKVFVQFVGLTGKLTTKLVDIGAVIPFD